MTRVVEYGRPRNLDFKRGAEGDGYFDRVAKYIPAEVVAAYVLCQGIIVSANAGSDWKKTWLIIVIIVLVVLTPFYFWRMTPPGQPWAVQAGISTVALLVWIYALGDAPTIIIGQWSQAGGSIVLALFTLAVGIIMPSGPNPPPPSGSAAIRQADTTRGES